MSEKMVIEQSPLNIGDRLDVKIEGLGEKGDGFAKIDNFVIFVPDTKQGDEVKIEITNLLKRCGFGRVIE